MHREVDLEQLPLGHLGLHITTFVFLGNPVVKWLHTDKAALKLRIFLRKMLLNFPQNPHPELPRPQDQDGQDKRCGITVANDDLTFESLNLGFGGEISSPVSEVLVTVKKYSNTKMAINSRQWPLMGDTLAQNSWGHETQTDPPGGRGVNFEFCGLRAHLGLSDLHS